MKISEKQQLNMAYELATYFTENGIKATELAEEIIKLCKEFIKKKE